MALVRCKKHGRTGMIVTCNHLSESVWSLEPITDSVKRVEKEDSDVDEWGFYWEYLLCKSCSNEYSETSIGEMLDNLKGSCAQCFKELRIKKVGNN